MLFNLMLSIMTAWMVSRRWFRLLWSSGVSLCGRSFRNVRSYRLMIEDFIRFSWSHQILEGEDLLGRLYQTSLRVAMRCRINHAVDND